MLSQTSINVNWEIQQASMLCQIWPFKYAAQKCPWMDIPAYWNWFNKVFYPQKNFSPSSFDYGQYSTGYFEPFQRNYVVECCFTSNVTRWKQPCNLEVIAVVKKDIKSVYRVNLFNLINFCFVHRAHFTWRAFINVLLQKAKLKITTHFLTITWWYYLYTWNVSCIF